MSARLRLPRFTREEVTAWFETFGVSFLDPNLFCDIVSEVRENHRELSHSGLNGEDLQRSGVREIWEILEDISRHPSHRHRRDARKIIREVEARERGEDESLLIPEPLPVPYDRPDRLHRPYPRPRPEDVLSLENIQRTLPSRLHEDDLPIPTLRIPQMRADPPPDDYSLNDQLSQWIPDNIAVAEPTRALIETALGAEALDPGLLPYKYADDPAEVVLNMPDDCPFIVAPTPPHDELLLDQRFWPGLEIQDNRKQGIRGILRADSYIYRILAWARMRMAQPNIARSYCLLFRADPRRYQEDTDEELSDEPPPTTEEVNAMIGFITKTMPTIVIYRPKSGETDLAYHMRTRPTIVYLNGMLFDAIERMHRDGEDSAAIIWLVVITFFHECGHYYYSVINGPELNINLRTPRRLRYLVSHSQTDAENHPHHNPWHVRYGEMGEMIEWLVFGVYTCMTKGPNEEPQEELFCLCWGSYDSQRDDIIRYGSYVASRLIAAPVRMNNERLRHFIDLCYRQRRYLRENQQREEELVENEVAATLAAMATLPSAGDGTTAGVIGFMDTEMTDAEDAATPRALEFTDVDEDFTGYNIGRNKAYRRAIWRVRSEIDADADMRADVEDAQEKTIIDLPRPPEALQVKSRQRIIYRGPAPLVPRTLPDHIRPWALMLGISVYTAFCVWVFMNLGSWCPTWLEEVHYPPKMAYIFVTVVISFGIYMVPLRRLLKPLGMVRPAGHGYFDWRTTVRNPFDVPRCTDIDWSGKRTPKAPGASVVDRCQKLEDIYIARVSNL